MAKISTYNIDPNVSGNDLLLGTEVNSTPPNLTKNFKVDDVFEYTWGWRYIEHYIDNAYTLRNLATQPFTILPAQGANVVIVPLSLSVSSFGDSFPPELNQYLFGTFLLEVGLDDGTGVIGTNPWISGGDGNGLGFVLGWEGRNFVYYNYFTSSPNVFTVADANKAMLFAAPSGATDSPTGEMAVKIEFQYQLFSL